MPRPKKGDPELLLVSFCDIVTITTAALFMAMVVVIDQASKTPIFRPTPIAVATTNNAVFFECRKNQIFFIDQTNLLAMIEQDAEALGGKFQSTEQALRELLDRSIGDKYYKVDTRFLLLGEIALTPKPDVLGIAEAEVKLGTNQFTRILEKYNADREYVVFFVRDDSFPVFREARSHSVKKNFMVGWEFLELGEPITFVGAFAGVKTQ